jgi:hypothetical protein
MIATNMIANDVEKIYTNPVTENSITYAKGDLVIDAEVANELFSVSPNYTKVLVQVNGDKVKLYGIDKTKTEIPVKYANDESKAMLNDWYAVVRNIDTLSAKPTDLYTGKSLNLSTYDTDENGHDYNIKLSYLKTDVKGLYKLKSQTVDNTHYSYTWLDNKEANDLLKQHATLSNEVLHNDEGVEFFTSLK